MKGIFWTEKEDKELIELREGGLTNREISDEIPGRTFNAVVGRLSRLRSKREVL